MGFDDEGDVIDDVRLILCGRASAIHDCGWYGLYTVLPASCCGVETVRLVLRQKGLLYCTYFFASFKCLKVNAKGRGFIWSIIFTGGVGSTRNLCKCGLRL